MVHRSQPAVKARDAPSTGAPRQEWQQRSRHRECDVRGGLCIESGAFPAAEFSKKSGPGPGCRSSPETNGRAAPGGRRSCGHRQDGVPRHVSMPRRRCGAQVRRLHPSSASGRVLVDLLRPAKGRLVSVAIETDGVRRLGHGELTGETCGADLVHVRVGDPTLSLSPTATPPPTRSGRRVRLHALSPGSPPTLARALRRRAARSQFVIGRSRGTARLGLPRARSPQPMNVGWGLRRCVSKTRDKADQGVPEV